MSGAWDQFRIPAGLRARRLGGALLHRAFDDIAHLSRKQGSAMARRVAFLNDGKRSGSALRVRFGLPVFFLRNYLLRGQWREGRYGFLFALTTAYNHWLRYAMLYERLRCSCSRAYRNSARVSTPWWKTSRFSRTLSR